MVAIQAALHASQLWSSAHLGQSSFREASLRLDGNDAMGRNRRIGDRIDIFRSPVFGNVGAPEQIDGSANDGQKVVEIVGDAPSELPDRLHPLRLTQGILSSCKL